LGENGAAEKGKKQEGRRAARHGWLETTRRATSLNVINTAAPNQHGVDFVLLM
jgi:hypothetical protein